MTTRTDALAPEHVEPSRDVPVLVVAFHPEPHLIGRRYALAAGEQLVLGRPSTLFGRRSLDQSSISREHARIETGQGTAHIRDLGSRNGTFVNTERVGARELYPGDVISIGPVLLLYRMGPPIAPRRASERLVGVSAGLGAVLDEIQRASQSEATVLIQGETGVGKELVAQELHDLSGRQGKLIAVNCGALTDGVVHSELFGHARGAFSGAVDKRDGLVAAAGGGTLLLDEIGDAGPALQASLLRLLEQREYRPVGSDRTLQVEAHFVAATHIPLGAAVAAGRFRRDLFARLDRWMLHVPPLRDRLEDVVPLALHFGRELLGRPVTVSRPLAQALLRYPWPNNVRELRAVIEQCAAECDAEGVLPLSDKAQQRLQPLDDTTDTDVGPAPGAASLPPPRPPPRKAAKGKRAQRPDEALLRAILFEEQGNVRAVAQRLGASRNAVYRWLRDAGLDPAQARGDPDGE